MSGLASDVNTLHDRYHVDVNEERAIDQVSKFTDDDSLRANFSDNLKIHPFALPKRKVLNIRFEDSSDKALETDENDFDR